MSHFLSAIFICFFFGIFLLLYATVIEPYSLDITRYNVHNPHIPNLKIVFISDLHIGPSRFEEHRFNHIVEKINQENADLIFLGGDYVKGHQRQSSAPIQKIVEKLSTLKNKYGIFAVLGNHDNYYGKQEVLDAFSHSNIIVLDNQNVTIPVYDLNITIAGVSDLSTDKPDIDKALSDATSPTILLSHSPDLFPDIKTIDLMLAGHTHGGQIVIPFVGAPLVASNYGQRYRYGFIREPQKNMIVSKGLGTSLLPVRFNCRPEIVVIQFTP